MLKYISPTNHDWCDICHRKNSDKIKNYILDSDSTDKKIIICNACLDDALFATNKIPETF